MPPIIFCSEAYVSRSLPLSAQRLVNAFAEQEHQDAKSQLPLMGAPGLTQYAECGGGPIRGSWVANGVPYFVSGQLLYSVDQNGTAYLLSDGVQISGSSQVSMSDNGAQVCIVNGQQGYIYIIGNGPAGSGGDLVQITDPNFYPAYTVTYYDTYFVFDKTGTNEFFLSNPNDGTTYNGLLFASAEAVADLVMGCEENLELLYIFGQKHIEMWYDAGTSDFPFQLYAGGVISRGLASPYAKVKQDDAIFFLGTDGVFYRLQGLVPIRISTHPIENAIATFNDVGQAFCFTYTLQGHKMVHLTFPTSNVSFVWDISTNRWHERESWNSAGVNLGRWRGNTAVQLPNPNQILIGDAYTGQVGLLDWDNQTEYGNTIQMSATSVPIHKDKKRVFVSRLEFDFEQGVGTTTGQGANPVVMLSASKDGGRTWVLLQPWKSLGPIGAYLTRQRYTRLGQARVWVFRIQVSDPVKRVMINAHADLSVGM